MKKLIYMLITVSLLVTTKNICAASRSVDVSRFDIAGVKLGMTTDQAVNAITSTLGINKSQIKFTTGKVQEFTGDAEVVFYFDVVVQSGSYRVTFSPDLINGKKGQIVVASVKYTVPYNVDNIKAMGKAMISKYGQPSTINKLSNYVSWCLSPEQMRCSHSKQTNPFLQLDASRGIAVLKDQRYEEALIKYLDKKKTTKPIL